MLLGSLLTLVVQQSYKQFSVWLAPSLKNNETKTKRSPRTHPSNPKNNSEIRANSVEKEILSKCRFYVVPNGQCIHKNQKCCGMKNPHELNLCTKCFG